MDGEGAAEIVVVGASAGGVEALSALICDLPSKIPNAFFVVLHLSPHRQSQLPAILARTGRLPAAHPLDGEKIKPGRIYVAPPDFHLIVGNGVVRLDHGPKEHHLRPSIDRLFCSAAQTYGNRVVGIVLTGMLWDGVAGLKEIRRHSGLAVVQDPAEAGFEQLPENALAADVVDVCLPVAQIRELLAQLPNCFDRKWDRGHQES